MNNMNREEYRKIKAMNKEQLEQYLMNFASENYTNGYNAGISAMSKEMAERVDKGIRNTSGIGEKRYKELITNINIELNREEGEKSV